MVNDTIVAVRGYAGGNPKVYENATSGDVTTVNLGVTPRYFSRETNRFEDGNTIWYTVRARGTLGRNIQTSVTTGTSLLVRGRLDMREWTGKDGSTMRGLTLFADAVGIELTTGRASFVKVRPDPSMETNDGSAGTVSSADTAAGESAPGDGRWLTEESDSSEASGEPLGPAGIGVPPPAISPDAMSPGGMSPDVMSADEALRSDPSGGAW
ncbi:single-stranded DNA-binding protein [Actinotignum sp. GS-2025c]|uniref:single-stranded DNA-binding protein n=1 Tax=Actinotignum sp. GS-2025c TaxID=3427276 RepID=UPI003F47168F